jgi:hypothetical protein
MLCIICIDFNLNTKPIGFWVNHAGLTRPLLAQRLTEHTFTQLSYSAAAVAQPSQKRVKASEFRALNLLWLYSSKA